VPHKVHQIGRVLAVVNGESRIEADPSRIVAQEPGADPMEGPGPKRIGHDTGVVAEVRHSTSVAASAGEGAKSSEAQPSSLSLPLDSD
jgi:hypothetical protein